LTFADFRAAILTFLREEVPRKWDTYFGQVIDNFRIILPKNLRVLTSTGYIITIVSRPGINFDQADKWRC
jgi:hypothetical protein